MGNQERWRTKLMDAAAAGDTKKAVKCLSGPTDDPADLVNAITVAYDNGFIETAAAMMERAVPRHLGLLTRMIRSGRTDIVALCRNVDALIVTGNLHMAILSGDLAIVKLICEAGADIDAEFEFEEVKYHEGDETHTSFLERFTPLMLACFRNDPAMVTYLLGRHADPHLASSNYKQTALYEAARVGSTQITQLLIDCGVELEPVDSFGDTPATVACRCNNTEAALLLFAHNCDVNRKNNAGDTPLLYASRFANAPLVERLIELGAEVNTANREKMTPLLSAGDVETAQILLRHGATGKIGTGVWTEVNRGREFEMVHEHRTFQGDYDSRDEGEFTYRGVLHGNRSSLSVGDHSLVDIPATIEVEKDGSVEFRIDHTRGSMDRYVLRPL